MDMDAIMKKAKAGELTTEDLDEIKKKMKADELTVDDLDQVSGGGCGLTESEINKIRDKDVYSLTKEEKKYIYYRLRVLRNAQGKSLAECKDICAREFYRFAYRPAVEEFVEIWYPRNIKVTEIEFYLSLYDLLGDDMFN